MTTATAQPNSFYDTITLPGGMTSRMATLDDFAGYYALLAAASTEDFGGFNMTEDEVRADWTTPGWDLATAARGVFTADERMIGYASIWDINKLPVRPRTWVYVVPEYQGQGIEEHLLTWAEQRARLVFERVPADAKVTLMTYVKSTRAEFKRVVEAAGMSTQHSTLDMEIEFDAPPPAPQFPAGIRMMTYAEHPVLEDFIAAQRIAFRDHRGFVEEPLENVVTRWRAIIDAAHDFVPELWGMAMDGAGADAKPAGVLFGWRASEEDEHKAWIDIVGVLPDYRKQGLGLALLYWVFGELYARGIRKAALGVDGSSLTGATRLYERAGMHVAAEFHVYEQVLRDGVELSVQ